MLNTNVFAALLVSEEYNPVNKSRSRACTLASADVQSSSDHVKASAAGGNTNLLCSRDAMSMNIERLKLLKRSTDKLKEINTVLTAAKIDSKKAALLGQFRPLE